MIVLNEVQPIRIYVDTNLLLDFINKRRRTAVCEFFFEKMKETKWECITSAFTLMELVDRDQWLTNTENLLRKGLLPTEIAREREQKSLEGKELEKDLKEVMNFFQANKKKIRVVKSSEKDFWDFNIDLLGRINISAPDVIHLTTALTSGCEIFLSGDKHLISSIKSSRKIAYRVRPLLYERNSTIKKFQTSFNNTVRSVQTKRAGKKKKKKRQPSIQFRGFLKEIGLPVDNKKEMGKRLRKYEELIRLAKGKEFTEESDVQDTNK